MGRQLFLHHYLPAHLASALVAGALLEFVCNLEPADSRDSVADAFARDSAAALTTDGSANARGANGKKKAQAAVITTDRHRPVRERVSGRNLWVSWAAAAAVLAIVAYSFFFFAPLTYGKPGLTVDEVVARKWLGYDLHFAK